VQRLVLWLVAVVLVIILTIVGLVIYNAETNPCAGRPGYQPE
jgi:hypothetical protein